MYPDILEPEALELTEKLDFLKRFDFYLVGGTGLALQWAHRKSVDFDFFTSKEFTPEVLSSTIREQGIVFVEKLRTISDRGLKKDFYDFYIGINKLGIESVVDLVYRKFGDSINYLPLVRGLIYFEDAERSKEELIFLQEAGR